MKSIIIKDLSKKNLYTILTEEDFSLFFKDLNKKNNEILITICESFHYKKLKQIEEKNQWVYPVDIELNLQMYGMSIIPALRNCLNLIYENNSTES